MLPMAVDADLASLPLPDVPDKDIVAVYAKLVGELLYICINTVPEIMYALGALTRYMTKATSQHYGSTSKSSATSKVSSISSSHGARAASKLHFSVVRSLVSPMPAGPTTSLRAAARYAMCCAATAQLSHGNQLLLLSSLSLRVRLSSSAWLPAFKK